jgi:hypothetical protein
MRLFILSALFLFSALHSFGQKSIRWEDLSEVSFKETYSNDLGEYIMMPSFSDEIKALDGKDIIIKGHVIPLDIDANSYVLSANPFASCFFCGNSGPETVMELKLKAKNTFQVDDYKSFRGTLRLNSKDVYSLNYILENARLVN